MSRRTGDTLELENGLKIFPGMETDVAEAATSCPSDPWRPILELNRRLEPNKEKGCFLSFARLMDLFEEYPVVVGCGHPFRAGGHVPELPQDQLRRLRFLDLNGKDLALDRDRTERLTHTLGKKLGIPVVSGSDNPPGSAVRLRQPPCLSGSATPSRPSMRRCGRAAMPSAWRTPPPSRCAPPAC